MTDAVRHGFSEDSASNFELREHHLDQRRTTVGIFWGVVDMQVKPDAENIFGIPADRFAGADGKWRKGYSPIELATSCQLLSSNDPTTEEDRVILGRAVQAMRPSKLDALKWSFFSNITPSWVSPLTGDEAPLIGGIPSPKGSLYCFFGGENPFTLLIARRRPVGIYYHKQHLLILNRKESTVEKGLAELRGFFDIILAVRQRTEAYFEKAAAGTLKRALILGDARPSHYLSQTVGFYTRAVVPRISEFAELEGRIIALKDGCFIDPRRLFPTLSNLPLTWEKSPDVTEYAFREGLHCNRFLRHGSDKDFTAIHDFFAKQSVTDEEAGGELVAWIVLDVEKSRFLNQVEVVAAAIDQLHAAAMSQGKQLRILWDGWTVRGGLRTAKDYSVIGRAYQEIAAIHEATAASFLDEALFDFDLVEKLITAKRADIALASYGTASMMANVLADVPCVTYGVFEFVRQAEYANKDKAIIITEPSVIAESDSKKKYDSKRFSVPPAVILSGLAKLMARGDDVRLSPERAKVAA